MKSTIIILSLVSSLFLFSACESLVTNVDIPDQEKKIVLTAYLSPQDNIINVILSETMPLFDTVSHFVNIEYFTDAVVFISDGSNTKQMNLDVGTQTFTLAASQMPIVPSKTYWVTVQATDGREVEGETTVPVMTDHGMILEDTTEIINEWYTEVLFTFKFNDPAGVKNYYRFFATVTWENSSIPGDTIMEYLYNDTRSEFIDDANFDGGSFRISYRSAKNEGYSIKSVRAHFMVTDRSYYLFHRSFFQNQYSDIPFAEPVIIFSNVQNGRGVVASYNTQVVDCTLP